LRKSTEDLKETLLRFVTAELTSHASLIIGFSIILFAYLNVISQFYPDRVPFILSFYPSTALRYLAIFLILWVLNTLIMYTLIRLAYYGKLATLIIFYDKTTNSSMKLWKEVTDVVKKATLFKIPMNWYSKGMSIKSIGFWFSLFVGFVMSFILMWTFLFY